MEMSSTSAAGAGGEVEIPSDSGAEVEGEDLRVVSEINTFLVSVSDVKPMLRPTNRVAKLRFSLSPQMRQNETTTTDEANAIFKVDKDGGLIIPCRREGDDDLTLFIEYFIATSLEQVGLQLWRGAFLTADFIMHSSETFFKGKTVLEFGSGTGLSGIVASMFAAKVIATDLNDPNILRLIETNVAHNKEHVRSEFLVKALDFKDLSWDPDLEACIRDADVLLAADVVYSIKITEAFVRTLKKCLNLGKPKSVFIAIEKRYVFTVSDLDVVAPMYENFLELLKTELGLSRTTVTTDQIPIATTGPRKLSIRPVHLDFPQYFNYERNKELVLWHIQSEIC